MIERLARLRASLRAGWTAPLFGPPLSYVKARLSLRSDTGLRLTFSVLLLVGAAWLFAGVAEDVVSGDRLVDIDLALSRWLHERTTPGVSRWMQWITDAHSAMPISALGLVFALHLAWRRHGLWLLTLLLVLPGGMLVNLLLKQVFHRGRSAVDEPLQSLASYSFPSGHVAGATLLYGLMAAYMAARTTDIGKQIAAFAVAIFMVVAVGASRLYLGAHYFSDVVAGAAGATAWLVLCAVAVHARVPQPPA